MLIILCPECLSRNVEQHPKPNNRRELICKDCKAEIKLAHIQYTEDVENYDNDKY